MDTEQFPYLPGGNRADRLRHVAEQLGDPGAGRYQRGIIILSVDPGAAEFGTLRFVQRTAQLSGTNCTG